MRTHDVTGRNPGSARAPAANWYLAFADWRIEMQSPANTRKSAKFFRQSRSHTLIWTMVMRGHYMACPPAIRNCINAVTCARQTARNIIYTAEAKGYFELRPAIGDSRKKLVCPTLLCLAEYEAMVDVFLALADVLHRMEERSKN